MPFNPLDEQGPPDELSNKPKHPRHRLGVASLALDASTHLVGRNAPEGILYSGGRDGLVMSWDLGIAMKKKAAVSSTAKRGRWEAMTGWGDDAIEEEEEDGDDRVVSDGDILGEVTQDRRRRASAAGEIPFEHQWETDISSFKPGMVRMCHFFSRLSSQWSKSQRASDNVLKCIRTG